VPETISNTSPLIYLHLLRRLELLPLLFGKIVVPFQVEGSGVSLGRIREARRLGWHKRRFSKACVRTYCILRYLED